MVKWRRVALIGTLAVLVQVLFQHEYTGELTTFAAKQYMQSQHARCTKKRPNFVFLTAEDMSSRIGSFGDDVALTPNLDALARESVLFTNVHTTAPVCSPSRSSLWTGVHQTRLGTHNMRTNEPPAIRMALAIMKALDMVDGSNHSYEAVIPEGVHSFTEELKKLGYYVVNTGVAAAKTDYQFGEMLDTMWHDSSKGAHWRDRPDPDMPFFYYCNFLVTHESGLFESLFWRLTQYLNRDGTPFRNLVGPEHVNVPTYLPDTPIIREQIAKQYNNVAVMDAQVGHVLEELKQDGLWESTIVIFSTDHGSALPRGKRYCYDSGTKVPLMLKMHGSTTEREPGTPRVVDELVSFLDIAPTILSFAAPEKFTKFPFMEGRVFFGEHAEAASAVVYCAVDRLDGNVDLKSRSVRTKEWRLVENVVADEPYLAPLSFRDQAPGYQELLKIHDQGNSSLPFLAQDNKPRFELYNVRQDPEEVKNVVSLPENKATLERLNQTLQSMYSKDLGITHTEDELVAEMYPNVTQPRTEPVMISIDTETEPRFVLSSTTPSASILYRFKRRGYAYFNHEVSHWFVYTESHGPTNLDVKSLKQLVERFPDVFLEAKATRYGYKDSDSVMASLSL